MITSFILQIDKYEAAHESINSPVKDIKTKVINFTQKRLQINVKSSVFNLFK